MNEYMMCKIAVINRPEMFTIVGWDPIEPQPRCVNCENYDEEKDRCKIGISGVAFSDEFYCSEWEEKK